MNKKILRIVGAALLLAVAYLIERSGMLSTWQLLLVYLVPYLLVGYDVVAEAVEGIREGDPFDEDLLMVVATIGALFIGFLPGAEPQFPEAVFVMLFFQVGEVFEDYAEDRSRKSISDLMDIRPDTARLVTEDGKEQTVSPEQVAVGQTVLVRPGEKIPMDGEVIDGSSSLNTVALTGESLPRDVHEGDDVVSGCVNLSGVLRIRVTKPFAESTATKIIEMVEHASDSKSKSETFISRFAHVYTPIVVYAAIALAFIPPFFSDNYFDSLSIWLYRALTFLVVSCPCALVISVPLTFFGGIGGASRHGILVKGGNYMDALSKVSRVVFDKTGTLTRGVFRVQAVHPDKMNERELLHLAAHVEHFSTHPIAAALRQAYGETCDVCKVEKVEELAGRGIRAQVNGHVVCVGNDKMMTEAGAAITPCTKCEHETGVVVHVSVDGQYAGHVVIADEVKSDAREAVESLKRAGVERTVMLTGDREAVAGQVAKEVGIDEYHAALLPADKVNRVEELLATKRAGTTLAFVGDGINDAPVLARADIGIAMGALGSDAAIEAADVVLMDDKPSKIATAIRIARHTVSIARQNVVFAITVKVLVLVLAAIGLAGMGAAVFADVGVMVLAVINAMRTIR
ncbi:MAG: heavy metal translocating P-type ATPase [Prevotella sp.]|jgi:Cd2+/Zn2+-exporting ATPase